MADIKKLNINDYYKELLEGKDLSIPQEKSWKLIKDRNKGREGNIAFSEDDRKITYGEMFEDWDECARVLSSLGINRENSSRILTIMPNVAKTGTFDYSADMTGAVIDFIDPTTSKDKIERYIKDEKITDLIISDLLYLQNLLGSSGKLKKELGIRNIILYQDAYLTSLMPNKVKRISKAVGTINRFNPNIIRYQDAVKNSIYTPITYDTKKSDELSLITHTSGTTTGMGKPIPITDVNRNALVKQHDLAGLNFNAGMKMLHFIPYFAAYGAVNTAHLGLSKGMELQQLPLFNPANFGKDLMKYKPNIVLSIFSAWLSLVNDPAMKNADLSFLDGAAVSGGSPTNIEDEKKINDFLLSHGAKVTLTKGYGLSELCGCAAYTLDGYNEYGKMGVVLPLSDLLIRDEENNNIYIPNKKIQGEALISSPTLTSGILDNQVVVETIDINGKKYLPTKDIVSVSENGTLKFIDRKDRAFARYDGYNVYPLQIEDKLKECEGISDCFIVPIINEENTGMVPKIYIESDEIVDDKENFIKNLLENIFFSQKKADSQGYMANFRDTPRQWVFIEKMPKNTMGKTDLSKLKSGTVVGDEYVVSIVEDNMSVYSYDINRVKDKVKIK